MSADTGVLAQPLREGGGLAVGQDLDGHAPLEVHQERAIRVAASIRPVVHAQDTRRGHRERRRATYQTEERDGTRRGPEERQQSE